MNEDPGVQACRREATIVLVVWGLALSWSVGYCSLFAYNRDFDSLTFILGVPDWVFWGVAVPWGVCTLFSVWFAFVYMSDDDLGEESEETATDFGELE